MSGTCTLKEKRAASLGRARVTRSVFIAGLVQLQADLGVHPLAEKSLSCSVNKQCSACWYTNRVWETRLWRLLLSLIIFPHLAVQTFHMSLVLVLEQVTAARLCRSAGSSGTFGAYGDWGCTKLCSLLHSLEREREQRVNHFDDYKQQIHKLKKKYINPKFVYLWMIKGNENIGKSGNQ